MSFTEIALRIYIVVSALPVLGFMAVLVVDVAAANKKKRQDLTPNALSDVPTGMQIRR